MKCKTTIKLSKVWKKFVIERKNTTFFKERILRNITNNIVREEIWALKNISLKVKGGECLGVIGKNGSGKTTLLKVIAGILKPTKGEVYTKGKVAPFLALGSGFENEFTGRENVYLQASLMGLKKREINEIYDRIVEFSELFDFMDVKLKNYSDGMKARLAFSIATHLNADIILVDEILTVGDGNFQRKCMKKFEELKNEKKTIVFVSHSLEDVKKICDITLYLHRGEMIDIGPTSKIVDEYEEHLRSNFIEYPVLVDHLREKNEESLSRILDEYSSIGIKNIVFPQFINKKKRNKIPKIIIEFEEKVKLRNIYVQLNNHVHSFQILTQVDSNKAELLIDPSWLMRGDYMLKFSIFDGNKNINLDYPLYFRVKNG
jgi:ABC-2 type transport system ATP-binding protein/lipopolysaccharide transport system ATP-binding protein